MLNYLYAVLESEVRLAADVLGLDPGLGVLHTDGPVRDSLAATLWNRFVRKSMPTCWTGFCMKRSREIGSSNNVTETAV